MNKTISVNLGGALFNVEEDAFEVLKKYLDSIKTYFAKLDDQGEVVEDIEARIADQLAERKSKEHKNVVTLFDIEELIKTMGTIEDITDEEKIPNNTSAREKRLYRNEDGAIIAGVCSGMAAYLGTDPVWLRLIFAAGIFFGGSTVLIYIILWIAMPAAKTPTEKMEMYGKKITLSGVQETLKTATHTVGGKAKNIFEQMGQFIRAILQRIFYVFGKIIQKFGRAISTLSGICITLSGIALIITAIIAASLVTFPWGNYYLEFPAREVIQKGLYWGIVSAGLLAIIIPLVFGLLLGVSLIRRRLTFTFVPTITLLSIWVISCTALVIMVMSALPAYNNYIDHVRSLPIITREYTDRFSQIKMRNVRTATIKAGSEYKVIVRSPETSLNMMNISVAGDELNISRKNSRKICIGCRSVRALSPVDVHITAPSLKDINISGASKIEIEGFKDDQFAAHLYNGREANVSLASKDAKLTIWEMDSVTVSGTAQTFSAELHGFSHEVLHAFDLKTSTTTINIPSSNMLAEVYAEKSLSVFSGGEGKIIYKGTPVITEVFDEYTLENLRFQYNDTEYPVTVRRINNDKGVAYEIKIDNQTDSIPKEKIVNVKYQDKNYTARIRVNDEYGQTELYDIKTEVPPPSIIEAF